MSTTDQPTNPSHPMAELPEEFSGLKQAPESLLGFFPNPKCILLLASPIGIQALVALKAAKAAGKIHDKNQCMDLAGDASKLGQVLGGPLAGLIAGETAKCACKQVF